MITAGSTPSPVNQFEIITRMVRLKHRYVLFDVLYPPSSNPSNLEQRRHFSLFSQNPKECLLQLHRPSPPSVSGRNIAALIRNVIDDHFGETAAGAVGLLVIVKYFSNKTSTGIIRCSRTDFQKVVAALALANKIEDLNVVMRCVHVSGTIRKCEAYSIRRNRELMIEMGKTDEGAFAELMVQFGKGDQEEG